MTSPFFHPYECSEELNQHFIAKGEGAFSFHQIRVVADMFKAVGNVASQQQTLDFFRKLPKQEVIERAEKVIKLNRLLSKITINNDLPRTLNQS